MFSQVSSWRARFPLNGHRVIRYDLKDTVATYFDTRQGYLKQLIVINHPFEFALSILPYWDARYRSAMKTYSVETLSALLDIGVGNSPVDSSH